MINLVDPEKIREDLYKFVTLGWAKDQVYWTISALIASNQGMKFGRELLGSIEAALPGHIVRTVYRNRCQYVEVYGGVIPFDGRMALILGHDDTNDYADPSFFAIYNQPPDTEALVKLGEIASRPGYLERLALVWNLAKQAMADVREEIEEFGYPMTLFFNQ